MRRFANSGIVLTVPPRRAQLTIVFDLRADPIAGVVCDGGGGGGGGGGDCGDGGDGGVPFAGWMELTRAIERALANARRSAAGDPLARGPAASGADPASP
jgi:hypothetical protein